MNKITQIVGIALLGTAVISVASAGSAPPVSNPYEAQILMLSTVAAVPAAALDLSTTAGQASFQANLLALDSSVATYYTYIQQQEVSPYLMDAAPSSYGAVLPPSATTLSAPPVYKVAQLQATPTSLKQASYLTSTKPVKVPAKTTFSWLN